MVLVVLVVQTRCTRRLVYPYRCTHASKFWGSCPCGHDPGPCTSAQGPKRQNFHTRRESASGSAVHMHVDIWASFQGFRNKEMNIIVPKKMTITKPARHLLISNLAQQETIPDTTYQDTSEQCLISFQNMARVKSCMVPPTSRQGTPRKPFRQPKPYSSQPPIPQPENTEKVRPSS